MKVNGIQTRTIWVRKDGWSVEIIDQTRLPHQYTTAILRSLEDAAHAISTMVVRGAPLIGATAAYGMALAARDNPEQDHLQRAAQQLLATRPTAVNLRWVVEDMLRTLIPIPTAERPQAAYQRACSLCDEDVATNEAIGEHGLALLRELAEHKSGPPVNILTHCNAGWLATVDWGTALAPIYKAHDQGIPIHVWVDETRPRNQGASLTAWELGQHGVPHTIIADNVGGHLMQHQRVDVCITGTDRTTANGDVCNKIGTYLKALAAHDNRVPFYVGLPSPTIDWRIDDGVAEIPIEERNPSELAEIQGLSHDGTLVTVKLTPDSSPLANYAFDVTPARLVTGLITERGVCEASREGLRTLFPDIGKSE